MFWYHVCCKIVSYFASNIYYVETHFHEVAKIHFCILSSVWFKGEESNDVAP